MKGAAEILKQLKSKNMGYSKLPKQAIKSTNIKKTVTGMKIPKGGDIKVNSGKGAKKK